MKRSYQVFAVLFLLPLLSSCTVVETTTYPAAGYYAPAYTPAYYPGSPYWGSSTIYWRNSNNWYRHNWYGRRGYYHFRR